MILSFAICIFVKAMSNNGQLDLILNLIYVKHKSMGVFIFSINIHMSD